MNFADYASFRTQLQWLIEGDEEEDTLSIAMLDLIIGLGEQRVYADLRASSMLAPLALAVTNNVATLPDDLIELHYLADDANVPVEIIPYDRLKSIGPATGGRTLYAAQSGDTLEFWPSAPATLNGTYYKRPAALSTALNSTFNRYPEVFLFAALMESCTATNDTPRLPEFATKYAQAVASAHLQEQQRVYGGSRLRMRAL